MDNYTFSVSSHSFFHPKHILLIANYVPGTGIGYMISYMISYRVSYMKMLSVVTEHTRQRQSTKMAPPA